MANCPECGLSVAESRLPDTLWTAPAGWLRTQRWGVWLLVLSYVLSAFSVVAEMYRDYLPGWPDWTMKLLRIVPLAGLAAAVWLLTTQRPNRPVKRAGLLVRYGFLAVLVLAVVMPLMRVLDVPFSIERLGWTTFFVLLIVCWIGLGCIQARVARMMDLRWLVGLIWSASIVWSVALAVTAWFYIAREFTQRSPFTRGEPAYVYVVLLGSVLLVVSTMALAVSFSLRSRVRADG